MLIAPEDVSKRIIKSAESVGVKIKEIGKVDNSGISKMIKSNGEEEELKPLFREAAYTKIKKLVGETTPENFEIMKKKVEKSAIESIAKKNKVVKYIKKQ